jgi:hypothetical protein
MKKRFFASVVVLSFVLLAVSLSTHAQASDGEVVAKVAFAFHVGDESYPAGSYRVTRRGSDAMNPVLVIRADKGGDNSSVSVVTRLARQEHTDHATSGNLVFDRVGDERFLSEVWLPGEDGYLVRGTAAQHQHDIVTSNP